MSAQRDCAEMTAHVTFALHQNLICNPEAQLPGGTHYYLFGGFPGFCDFAGGAGLALYRVLEGYDIQDLIDIVDAFAVAVIHAVVTSGEPPRPGELYHFAAQQRGLAHAKGWLSYGAQRQLDLYLDDHCT